MSTIKKAGMGLLAGVVFSLGSPSAGRADQDHFRGRRSAPDVDIEGLRAQMRLERGQWLLSVSYRIEAENVNPASRLALVLSLDSGASCGSNPIVVPLRMPNACGRDEVVFQDCVVRAIPPHLVGNPNRVRLQASVIADGGRVLERDSTNVAVSRAIGGGRHRDEVRFGGSINIRSGRR
jgi:hypothetical protein